MRLLIIGAGGVGTSAAMIIKRRGAEADWAEKVVISDYDFERAKKVANEICGGGKFVPAQINAMDAESIKAVAKEHDITFAMNACDPRMNETIFDTCLEAGIGYLDCAMTLGTPHPEKPYELSNIKLGDYQFAKQKEWEASGQIAICGSGVEPGMADVFAKYAEKHLFDKIDEVNVRDGDNYGNTDSDFGFSVWTTIEECLAPPVIWEKNEQNPDGHWFCTEQFSEPEVFNFPGGIGDVEVVNVEHEEVLLVP